MLLHGRNALVRPEVQSFPAHQRFICAAFSHSCPQDPEREERGDFVQSFDVDRDVVFHAPDDTKRVRHLNLVVPNPSVFSGLIR